MRKDHRARYLSSHMEEHHQDLLQPLHQASYLAPKQRWGKISELETHHHTWRSITRTSCNHSTRQLTSFPKRMRKDHRAGHLSSHVEEHHQDLLQPLHRASYFIPEGGWGRTTEPGTHHRSGGASPGPPGTIPLGILLHPQGGWGRTTEPGTHHRTWRGITKTSCNHSTGHPTSSSREDEEGPQSGVPIIARGGASPRPPATTPPGLLFHPRRRMREDLRAGDPPSHVEEHHQDLLQPPHWASSFIPKRGWRRTTEPGTSHMEGHHQEHHQDLLQPPHGASALPAQPNQRAEAGSFFCSEVKRVEKGWASSYRVVFFFSPCKLKPR